MPAIDDASQAFFLDLGGSPVRVERRGQGEAVVFLHAGIADLRMWDPQVGPVTAAGWQTVRYDRPGFGQSPAADRAASRHGDLAALLDALGVGAAHLVGCSQGGLIALDFALSWPERVKSLTLVASALSGFEYDGPSPPEVAALEEAWEAADAAGDTARLNALEITYFVVGRHRTEAEVAPGVVDLVRDMNAIALSAPALGQQAPLDPPAIGRLGEIRAPTLIITGALDRDDTLAVAELLERGIPGAERVDLSRSAHLPSLEEPAAFNVALLRFLDAQRGR